MKKIFTFIFAVLATVAVAKADVAAFQVQNATTGDLMEGFQADLSKNADGSYTIDNFMNSGVPLTFALASEKSEGGYYEINFPVNFIDYTEDYQGGYITDNEGNNMTVKVQPTDGEAFNLNYVFFYNSGYSYAEPIIEGPMSMYSVYLNFTGDLDNGDYGDYYNVIFTLIDMGNDAIDSIGADDENAPVEYYNIEGMRIANPENGLYIRRQGSKVSKVYVK